MQQSKLPIRFLERLNTFIPHDKHADVLQSFQKTKPISIRINTIKTNKNSLIEILSSNHINTQSVPWYENALVITSGTKQQLTELEVYKNGYFYIQNLSSMIPAVILNPQPHEKILDIAAAPGSKTTQMAEMMQNTGEIIANDISRQRLFKLKAISEQLGVTNVKTMQIPGEFIWKKYPNYFDKVLIDAPCSMEGRFQEQYEDSYRDWSPKKIKVLSHLQKRILRSAFYSVKQGGSIVYSTCTLSPEENEEVIDWLLKEEKEHIKINVIPDSIPNDGALGSWDSNQFEKEIKKTLRIYPSETMEGFYVASITRIS